MRCNARIYKNTGLFGGVACGSGAVKPNLIVLGGDQYDESDPKELKQKSSYFSYFYWCTNIAAFIAFGIMVCSMFVSKTLFQCIIMCTNIKVLLLDFNSLKEVSNTNLLCFSV